jgi:drug/metabolite transporter (DMT)-like permease
MFKKYAPILGLVLLTLLWGSSWVIAKEALGYSPPFVFAAQRAVLGGLSLMGVLWVSKSPVMWQVPKKIFWIGLVQVSGFMLFQTWALVEGGPGKTAVLIFTMPIWTLILTRLWLKESLSLWQWSAAWFTLMGLIFIIEPWALKTSVFSQVLGLMAAFCWALGSLLVKKLRLNHSVDLLNITAWQMIMGSVPLVLLAVLLPEPSVRWTGSYVVILAFMSIVTTAFCWWLWIYILDRIPAWTASVSVLGTPVVAMMTSHWTVREQFSGVELSGITLIGIGLSLLGWVSWRANRVTC